MSFRLTTFAIILMLLLAACSGGSDRAGDAAPLSESVPEQSAAADSGPAETGMESPAPADNQPLPESVGTGTAVTFNIAGGIVGFCDELVVNSSGEYTLNSCQTEERSGTLTQSDRVSLKTWQENLTSFRLSTEDNPGGPDNLTRDLTFTGSGQNEANEGQQQIIYDWASGLVARLRSNPEAAPTPEPSGLNPEGMCPNIPRPALMLVDFEQPSQIELLHVNSMATCEIKLSQAPFGRVMAVGGVIYYPVANPDAGTVTVWRFDPDGNQSPLEFTTVVMEEPRPYDFVVSEDGSRIAWMHTEFNLEVEPPIYRNYLWLADLDGSNQVTVLDGVENNELRFTVPIRFSTADNSFYFALQPDIGGPVFSGRFDTLHRVPAQGGQPEQLYTCPAEENPVCINGVTPDASAFTIIDAGSDSIQILNIDGTLLNTIPLPATDYVERVAFSPAGDLAFVSASLTEPASEEEFPLPDPGYITVLPTPYTGSATNLLSDSSVGTLWDWLDDQRLIFGSLDTDGVTNTALLMVDGQVTELSSKFAVGVLR